MESKLPKPSGLKRPMIVPKSILPMDRIKANNIQSFGSKASQFLGSLPPLSRDLSNIPGDFTRKVRAKSPEMRTVTMNTRVKLRRSRSACEIRNMRPLKRTDTTIAPIPTKSARFGNSNISTLNHTVAYQATTITRNIKNNSAGNVTTVKRQQPCATTTRAAPLSTRNKPAATATATVAKKTASSTSTAVSTTGGGKAINKRIPPYDFKARYNDLLEKHKVLKQKYENNVEQMGNLESLPEQLEESQAQLYSTQEELKNSKTECECLQRQVKSQNIKLETLTNSFVKAKENLEELTKEHEQLKILHERVNSEVIILREKTQKLAAENHTLAEDLTLCKDQLFRSNIERKELHNAVMDLRGNIRVFCRVRPPLECEEDKLLCGWNYVDEATVEIQNPDLIGKNKTASHTFAFDQVFHPNTRQEDIFELVSPLIQSALDGYNVCIFAYGQTGSGKTYTMDGISTNVGVIPRTVDLLFDAVKNYKRLGWEYEIKVTFLEIYNEVLYDLLSNDQKEMEIRMVKNSKNDIYVSNITEVTVETAGHLRELMQIAKMNRATAATAGNERSSRSHAVTKIELIGRHDEKNEISIGKINLVDLAGSESPKTSIRMNETKNINRSLSELTNVILALLQKQDHIPYRNSKLTHLLMPSLGGNSKTLMFINVAPFVDCFIESVKSLRFAASVNSCKMSKAKRNRYLNTSSSTS